MADNKEKKVNRNVYSNNSVKTKKMIKSNDVFPKVLYAKNFYFLSNKKEMKKSQILGSVWITLILIMASLLGLVAHKYLGAANIDTKNQIFVTITRSIFSVGGLAFIGGILISAIIAASMSTADSQLLAASGAFASDLYKTTIRKKASDKEMMMISRVVVVFVAVVALMIALFGANEIMALVSAAWSLFGAAFGPAILLALFWRRFNYKGCVAGIVTGFIVSILWMILFNFEYYGFKSIVYNTNLYELLPGFVLGMAASIGVSYATKKPSEEVVALFDQVMSSDDLK